MTEDTKPGLLIVYDYFYPAYKAGGPIQSLTNLVLSLQHAYDITVLTGAYDLNEDQVLHNIKVNEWSNVILPQSGIVMKVWYAGPGEPGLAILKKIIRQVDPSTVYLNGIFSFRFVLIPLLALKKVKIVVCPRGMLQEGALAGKALKKRIFLSVLRMSGLLDKVTWHATTAFEAADISREFGKHAKILVAGNIPKKPIEKISILPKKAGSLKLVYLSLISEKKNLLTLIKIINSLEENVSLDIYGPVKDETYWKKCLAEIESGSGKVTYEGDVMPEKVQDVFDKYHASVLLTKGENFGHALYESLSAGRPVITSFFTPWNQLTKKKAGWNVDISDEQGIVNVIREICYLNQPIYAEFYEGAYRLANDYYSVGFDTTNYKDLFQR